MDKIWWEKTENARKFLSAATGILAGGRSVVLCLPERLPWRETMRDVLRKLLRENFSGTTYEIEAVDAGEKPQKYVMNNFCENKSGFRPYGDEPYAKFLAASEDISLNTACLWIQDANDAQADAWFKFMDDYHKFLADKIGGVFLLESGANFSKRSVNGVEILSYDRTIGDYDSFAFNILLASEFCNDNDLMKQYLAELVTQLVGNDVELGAACVKRSEDFLRNPREVFKEILITENFSSTKSEKDIEFAIWLTQMKLIFPLVEIFRHKLIKNYHANISDALPCNSSYGERVEIPEQVELGTLMFLVNSGRLRFDKFDWDELISYRYVRNSLAHLKTLAFDDLQKVFDKNSRR